MVHSQITKHLTKPKPITLTLQRERKEESRGFTISPDTAQVAKAVILYIYLTSSSLVTFLHLQKLHHPFSFSIQFCHDLLFSLNKSTISALQRLLEYLNFSWKWKDQTSAVGVLVWLPEGREFLCSKTARFLFSCFHTLDNGCLAGRGKYQL